MLPKKQKVQIIPRPMKLQKNPKKCSLIGQENEALNKEKDEKTKNSKNKYQHAKQ